MRLALLAAGWSPVYPCHVTSAAMRTKPIGTAPFRFVEFRQNEIIRLERNPTYWKPGLPYLDGIEYRIIASRSTRMLAFIAGKFDVVPTDVSVPLLKDIRSQAPQAQCNDAANRGQHQPDHQPRCTSVRQSDIRAALALMLDRKAFITLPTEGEARIGASNWLIRLRNTASSDRRIIGDDREMATGGHSRTGPARSATGGRGRGQRSHRYLPTSPALCLRPLGQPLATAGGDRRDLIIVRYADDIAWPRRARGRCPSVPRHDAHEA